MLTLSKSDFKLGRTCPTKLYYKKKGYPTTLDDDEYLKLLAKGGYMIEEIARLLYPNGVDVPHDRGSTHALQATCDLMDAGHTELFEPTFEQDGLLLRVDIFRMLPETKTIELIEVKAKSWDSSDPERPTLLKNGSAIRAEWQDYIADVAFQMIVLERIFRDYTVIPYLMMPDKAKTTSVDLLHRHFKVTTQTSNGFTNYDVEFTGDADVLRNDHFLAKVKMQEEVDLMRSEIEAMIPILMDTLRPELTRADPELGVKCRNCEFRTEPYDDSGFAACWGEQGAHEYHLFDLRNGTRLKGAAGKLFDEMIADGRTHLFDIDESDVCGANGNIGKQNERQLIQIQCTRDGVEWQDEALGRELAQAPYPLHFIDFETSSLAIPYHAGMAPYESVAFQWSCHTVAAPGAAPEHAEWINTVDAFPNIEFVRTLREQIGNDGSVLIWSHHERTILRAIRRQFAERIDAGDESRKDLYDWLDGTINSGRLLDMEKWCENWYFHPRMKGKTSIKQVCDAVWQANDAIRAAFPEYVAADTETGSTLSPYNGLPLALIDGDGFAVAVGTDAVKAYQSMMYGVHRDDSEARTAIQDALLRYCKLDTAAMVMIWRHWEKNAGA